MNKKQVRFLILPISILLLIYPTNTYPSFYQKDYFTTDERLRELAVQKNIVPEHIDEAYLWNAIENNNTVLVWIALRREDKVKLLDKFKAQLKQDGIIISNSSVHYVDQINKVIINNISAGLTHQEGKPGIRRAFQALAALEGDYDDGRDRIEILREFLGEEFSRQYKARHPKKYDYLLKWNTSN